MGANDKVAATFHPNDGPEPEPWVIHVEFTVEPDEESKAMFDKVISAAATRVGANTMTVRGFRGDPFVEAVS